MQTYEIDEYLSMFLGSLFSEYKQRRVKDMFNLLYNYNMIIGNGNTVSLPALEQALINVVVFIDSENDTKATRIENHLKEYVIEYFKNYGIYITHESELYSVVMLLDAYYTLLTIDKELVDCAIIKIEARENVDSDVMLLSDMLSEYCDLTEYEITTLIEDVNEDFFSKLEAYYGGRHTLDDTSNNETTNYIHKFLKADALFMDTDVVKDLITNGYRDKAIADYLPSVYMSIERNPTLQSMAYEITAAYYLATDTRNNMLNTIHDSFNFDIINVLNEKAESVEIVLSIIGDLVLKLSSRS